MAQELGLPATDAIFGRMYRNMNAVLFPNTVSGPKTTIDNAYTARLREDFYAGKKTDLTDLYLRNKQTILSSAEKAGLSFDTTELEVNMQRQSATAVKGESLSKASTTQGKPLPRVLSDQLQVQGKGNTAPPPQGKGAVEIVKFGTGTKTVVPNAAPEATAGATVKAVALNAVPAAVGIMAEERERRIREQVAEYEVAMFSDAYGEFKVIQRPGLLDYLVWGDLEKALPDVLVGERYKVYFNATGGEGRRVRIDLETYNFYADLAVKRYGSFDMFGNYQATGVNKPPVIMPLGIELY
jgi:hypothetical protein